MSSIILYMQIFGKLSWWPREREDIGESGDSDSKACKVCFEATQVLEP